MISCVLVLLLFASVAAAQNTPAPAAGTPATDARGAAPVATAQTAPASSTSENTPPGPPKISYVGGRLSIDALDSTLGEVLTKVAALTGVKIEIPEGASSERLPVVKLGPGPAREILSSLLYGSSFDYLIQASATDPGGIQNVVLMPREKGSSGGKGPELAAAPSHSPYARTKVSPSESDETAEPNSPVPAQPDNTPAQPSAATPAPTQPTQMDHPVQSRADLINRSGLTTEGAMSPPAAMDPQSVNQQLLQMYQQRNQMMQQQRQTIPPPAPANPANQ